MPGDMKTMILEAFVEQCQKKNIDKVTVKDVVESCGISRQTFYYHFQDILDVIEWGMEQAMQAALAISLREETLEGALEVFFDLAVQRRETILRLMQSQRRDRLTKIFAGYIEQYLTKLVLGKVGMRAVAAEDMEITKCFCTYGVVGVLLDCCGRGDADAKGLARQLARILKHI